MVVAAGDPDQRLGGEVMKYGRHGGEETLPRRWLKLRIKLEAERG